MKIEDRDVFMALKEYGSYQEIRAWLEKRQQMTLRDEFAAKAMQGQLAFSPHDSFDKTNTPDEVAKLAYRFADAMLAERIK